MTALAWLLKNPLLVLVGVLGILCAGLFTTAYVQGLRLDTAKAQLIVQVERAERAEKELKQAREDAARLDAALAQRDKEIALRDAQKAAVKAVVDPRRNTADDKEISPLMRDYMNTLGGQQ